MPPCLRQVHRLHRSMRAVYARARAPTALSICAMLQMRTSSASPAILRLYICARNPALRSPARRVNLTTRAESGKTTRAPSVTILGGGAAGMVRANSIDMHMSKLITMVSAHG